jgi:hypothetical protein
MCATTPPCRSPRRASSLLVELRGDEHADALAKQLEAAGYVARTAG